MKKKTIIGLGSLAAISTAVYAVTVVGTDLEIGNNSSASVASGTIGSANTSDTYSLTVGSGSTSYNRSLSVGLRNDTQNYSAAVGADNDVNEPSGSGLSASMAVGRENMVEGYDTLVSGRDNMIDANFATAFGRGLVTDKDYAHIVGKYNEDKASTLFVVGNGAGAASRSNALEVYQNGDVIINNAQGDIDDGIFGN